MMVESHWSQLKRLYILPYNWPRCDFLIYILDVKVLPKFISDYGLHLRDYRIIRTVLTCPTGHATATRFYLAAS